MDYKIENNMNQNLQQQYPSAYNPQYPPISIQPVQQGYPQVPPVQQGYSQVPPVQQGYSQFPSAQPGYVPYPVVDNYQNKNPKRDWSFSLFDCCEDLEALLCAYFCTPCFMYKIFERAGEGFCDCFCAGLVPLRTKIRTERAIQGSLCEDAFAVACCPLCVMVQISNEMKASQPLI